MSSLSSAMSSLPSAMSSLPSAMSSLPSAMSNSIAVTAWHWPLADTCHLLRDIDKLSRNFDINYRRTKLVEALAKDSWIKKREKRSKRKRKKGAPVIFMAKPTKEDCAESSGMSAFAFMSFAMAVVNGVINTANNVNDNNNNNNNNNNDNNNNLVNVNVANANNGANNENEAMAGRRRRMEEQERRKAKEVLDSLRLQNLTKVQEKEIRDSPENFATAFIMTENGINYKPLKIGYTDPDASVGNLFENQNIVIDSRSDSPEFIRQSKSESLYTKVLNQVSLAKDGFIDKMLKHVNSVVGKRKRRNIKLDAEQEVHFANHDIFKDLEGDVAVIALAYIDLVATAMNGKDRWSCADQDKCQNGKMAQKICQSMCQVRRMARKMGAVQVSVSRVLKNKAWTILAHSYGKQFMDHPCGSHCSCESC